MSPDHKRDRRRFTLLLALHEGRILLAVRWGATAVSLEAPAKAPLLLVSLTAALSIWLGWPVWGSG